MSELLTVAEVAQRLRVNPATVKRLVRAGQISGFRIGRQIRVPTESLQSYLDGAQIRVVVANPRRTEAWT